MARPLVGLAAALLLAAAGARAGSVTLGESQGKWESGYGVTFYNVVGSLTNTGGAPLAYVKLRIEGLDADGEVVASMDAYNESAEALGAPGADLTALTEAGKVTPVAAGAKQRFRGSFLKDEHPSITSHRVTVAESPAAK